MKRFLTSILSSLLILVAVGCREIPEYADAGSHDLYANFDALADIISNRYCYLSEKNINWPDSCRKYRAKIDSETTEAELFFIISDLLDGLKDGHVNLIAPFSTSYYKKWWSDFPQDFDNRTLQQYYLKFGGLQTNGMQYIVFIPANVGYIYFPSFSTSVSETALDYVLSVLEDTEGLIIDIRNNGGGYLTNVGTFVGRFIDHEVTGGYIRHKTGPGPDDFSEPYRIVYEPAGENRVHYSKPIAVLTNRSCFSAANNFVAVMKSLPQVRIVGARTGGGGGLPFSSEIPNGWAIRFSSCPITDPDDRTTEFGIDPSEGCEVHSPAKELAQGRDAILETAIKMLGKKQTE